MSVGGGTTIQDRIKNDFGVKKDRFVHLKLTGTSEQIPSWNEWIEKIKDGILTSYTNQLIQFDEDSRRLDVLFIL